MGNIMNNWTTCMKHIKEPDGQPCYINSWDKEYPSMIKIKTTYSDCMHDNCSSCGGTGIRKDGLGACIHMISCPCSKCSPTRM